MHDLYIMLADFFFLCVHAETTQLFYLPVFFVAFFSNPFFFLIFSVATIDRCFCGECVTVLTARPSLLQLRSAILSVFLLESTQAVSKSASY